MTLLLVGLGALCDAELNARISEPAADLAVMLAITSGLRGKPLPKGFLAFGEVGLAGEVRPAPRDHRAQSQRPEEK